MKRFILPLICLTSCFVPEELEDKSQLTSLDLNIKSVKTYYTDEYGDQGHRDGDMVGYAVFGNDGTLLNIKTTRSRNTMFQSNAHWINRYSGIPVNRLLWVLDGGIYGKFWKSITPFMTAGPEYPKTATSNKATKLEENKEMYSSMGGEFKYEIDDVNNPTSIKTSYILKDPSGDWTVRGNSSELLEYDDQGRILKIVDQGSSNRSGEHVDYERIETYSYDTDGNLTAFSYDDLDIKISKNENALVVLVEVFKNDQLQRWYTFDYLDNSLRSRSQAYNGRGELEFSIDYVYEFYN